MTPIRAAALALMWHTIAVVPAAAQEAPAAIVVAGSPVVSARPSERIDGEWFIPVAAVGRALGISVELAPDRNGVRARTRTGVETIYDGRTGEIRYGQVLIGRVKNFRHIVIAEPIETLLFPIDGIVALFGVSVTEDTSGRILRIDMAGNEDATGSSRPSFTIATLDYSVGVTTGEGQSQHVTSVRAEAIAGGIGLMSHWLVTGNGSQAGVRQGFGQADFGGNRLLGVGDQITRTAVDSVMTVYRGASFRGPVGAGFEAEVYAGRATGSVSISKGLPGLPSFDANVAGTSVSRRGRAGELSFTGQWFEGASRRGSSLGAAFVRVTPRHQFKAQLSFGRFSGLSPRIMSAEPLPNGDRPLFDDATEEPPTATIVRAAVDGTALGAGALYTFTPTSRVSLTMQGERYGRSFLTAREDAQLGAQISRRATVTVRPIRAVSFFAGVNNREWLINAGRLTGSHAGLSGRVPGTPVQVSYYTSRQQDSSSPIGRIDLRQYSATLLGLGRVSGQGFYSETSVGGEMARTFGGSLSRTARGAGRIGVLGQWQVRGSRRTGLEWERGLPGLDGTIRAAVERLDSRQAGAAPRYVPFGSATFALPFGQRFHMSYSGNPGNRTFSVTVSGPLARRRDIRRTESGITIEPVAVVAGRVYFDANGDGVFDARVDRGLSEVTVWIDDETSVSTGRDGTFMFERVVPGARALRAELDGVPADMAFAGEAARTIAAAPYRRNAQDFAVVRTGSAKATIVAILPGRDVGQTVMLPVADVRVVAVRSATENAAAGADDIPPMPTAAINDSYTDTFGNVAVTALPPGTYDLQIDPETIPDGLVATRGPLRVVVRPGEVSPEVQFVVAPAPKEVIRKTPGIGGIAGAIGGGADR